MVIEEIGVAIIRVYPDKVDVVIHRTYTPENIEQIRLLF